MTNTANTKQAPDYTLTNNPHCLIHCGPIGDDSVDDQRDLTVNTSSNCQIIYSKSGNKVEHIQGYYADTSGHEIDPDQKDAVARAIIAKNGDIILVAEGGSIRMKARNIYMETIDGENGHGKIMGNANGLIQFSTGDEFRVAAGKQCLIAKDKFNMVGNIVHAGEADMGNPLGKSSIFKSIMAGGWDSILNGVIKSCK